MRAVTVALVALALVGCGAVKSGAEKSKAENALKALSIDYLEFQQANQGRPAASAEELAAFVAGRPDAALRPGELETLAVQWGAALDPRGPDAGQRLLASGSKVGGEVPVMMQDGSVKWVGEAAFASLPKAEPAKRP
ncbi:MAG TPA: hypothetical protein VM529_16535 [Gemmata sp.]|nr:hypothetical protein [Gemmata sp.]